MITIKDYSTKTTCKKCGFEVQNTTFRRCPKCGTTPMYVSSDYKEEEY